MAGAGYKLFNTGDVLTAAQVNTYLQEQVVMVFANAAARTTALSGVLAEGMVTYLKDTDALEIYSGAAWVGYGSGDITGITTGATSGLTGGVASGTADLRFNTTAKGGLLVGTGSGTVSELSVGSNNTVLTADSSTATGLKWAAAAGGGKLLQIVDASYGTETNTTSTTLADLGLSASITPSSASSKVLILGVLNVGKTTTSSTTGVQSRLFRGTTEISSITSGAVYNDTDGIRGVMQPFMYLDNPATTSSTTYKVQVASTDGGNVIFNFNYSGSLARCRIFLLEIGA